MTDQAVKMIVKWLTTFVLPFSHTLPGSWYLLNKVANSRSIDEVVRY